MENMKGPIAFIIPNIQQNRDKISIQPIYEPGYFMYCQTDISDMYLSRATNKGLFCIQSYKIANFIQLLLPSLHVQPSPMSQMNAKKLIDSEFICKLVDMIEKHPTTINWDLQSGEKMIVFDIAEMEDEVLPQYFRHGNFASFIRQLNMYSFRKLYRDGNEIGFLNKVFKKGNEKNFHFIQRKKRVKQNETLVNEFKKKNSKILDKIHGDERMEPEMKILFRDLLEYKYVCHENIKKIKVNAEKICLELKDCRTKKIIQSVKVLRDKLTNQLNQHIQASRQIDKVLNSSIYCSSPTQEPELEPYGKQQKQNNLKEKGGIQKIQEEEVDRIQEVGIRSMGSHIRDSSFRQMPEHFGGEAPLLDREFNNYPSFIGMGNQSNLPHAFMPLNRFSLFYPSENNMHRLQGYPSQNFQNQHFLQPSMFAQGFSERSMLDSTNGTLDNQHSQSLKPLINFASHMELEEFQNHYSPNIQNPSINNNIFPFEETEKKKEDPQRNDVIAESESELQVDDNSFSYLDDEEEDGQEKRQIPAEEPIPSKKMRREREKKEEEKWQSNFERAAFQGQNKNPNFDVSDSVKPRGERKGFQKFDMRAKEEEGLPERKRFLQ